MLTGLTEFLPHFQIMLWHQLWIVDFWEGIHVNNGNNWQFVQRYVPFFHQSILFFPLLQALLPPKPDYPLADSLPEEIIKDCKLSSLQLEGILHAVRNLLFHFEKWFEEMPFLRVPTRPEKPEFCYLREIPAKWYETRKKYVGLKYFGNSWNFGTPEKCHSW